MPDKFVCFLDLLGFSHISTTDPFGAMNLLWDTQQILEELLLDARSHPIESYENPVLRELAQQTCFDSCEMFLPGSDSVFIVSGNATRFIPQLSHFLLSCFLFKAREYAYPSDPTQPHKVKIRAIGRGGSVSEVEANWYPTVFRGGMYYGDVSYLPAKAIVNGEEIKTANICGPAVVHAVGLEKSGKGPRLFCHEWVRDIVDPKYESYFVEIRQEQGAVETCESGNSSEKKFELLWPAFHYNPRNDCGVEIYEINDLLLPAINLWLAYKSQCFGKHYFEFLRLVIRSALMFFDATPCAARARDLIQSGLVEAGLQSEVAALMNEQ